MDGDLACRHVAGHTRGPLSGVSEYETLSDRMRNAVDSGKVTQICPLALSAYECPRSQQLDDRDSVESTAGASCYHTSQNQPKNTFRINNVTPIIQLGQMTSCE